MFVSGGNTTKRATACAARARETCPTSKQRAWAAVRKDVDFFSRRGEALARGGDQGQENAVARPNHESAEPEKLPYEKPLRPKRQSPLAIAVRLLHRAARSH